MKILNAIIKYAILLGVIGFVLYYGYNNKADLLLTYGKFKDAIFPPVPCSRIIKYSIGDFDDRFGVSRQQFESYIERSAATWEALIGHKLFEYSSDDPYFKVNLVYDYRQQTTDKLKVLDQSIQKNTNSYTALKDRYNSLLSLYNGEKTRIAGMVKQYEIDKDDYENKVTYLNSIKNPERADIEEAEVLRKKLNESVTNINNSNDALNSIVSDLNSAASKLNIMSKELNIKVNNYNQISVSNGEEFDEGEYVVDENGNNINVYQFTDANKLNRVLIHELGHVLGMNHVEDPQAIMYRLNQSETDKLTTADKIEFSRVCQTVI